MGCRARVRSPFLCLRSVCNRCRWRPPRASGWRTTSAGSPRRTHLRRASGRRIHRPTCRTGIRRARSPPGPRASRHNCRRHRRAQGGLSDGGPTRGAHALMRHSGWQAAAESHHPMVKPRQTEECAWSKISVAWPSAVAAGAGWSHDTHFAGHLNRCRVQRDTLSRSGGERHAGACYSRRPSKPRRRAMQREFRPR